MHKFRTDVLFLSAFPFQQVAFLLFIAFINLHYLQPIEIFDQFLKRTVLDFKVEFMNHLNKQ